MRLPRYLKGRIRRRGRLWASTIDLMGERILSTYRANTRVIVRDLGLIADQRLVELHNVGVLRSKLISRAVTADDYRRTDGS